MTRRVRIEALAKAELREAIAWYEERVFTERFPCAVVFIVRGAVVDVVAFALPGSRRKVGAAP